MIPKTKVEIIQETVEYYKKHPRGIKRDKYGNNLGCYYFVPEEPNCRCAVGRCLSVREPSVKALYDEAKIGKGFDEEDGETDIWTGAVNELVKEKLSGLDKAMKPVYRGHDVEFWQSLQSLHDGDMFWAGQKLTELGEKQVNTLIKRYDKTASPA